MSTWDRPGWAYLERDEVWYREISTETLDQGGAEYDFNKKGYWINLSSPLAEELDSKNCRFLTSWTQAKY
jgi:hypothetical protein